MRMKWLARRLQRRAQKRHNSTMSKRLIPLFPLQLVVFPRTPLPLHIFEERYKEMVGNAIRDNTEFGVVLAKDEGIVNAGCTVLVDKVLELYTDGRMDVMTHGKQRFEIVRLIEEKDYLQAEVSYFDDEDLAPVPNELRVLALTNYQALTGLAAARGHNQPNLEDLQLSFQLAQAIPDLDFLSMLLRERSEASRLQHFNRYLAEYLPRQQSIERMKHLAPTNGHGPKVTGL
jgi:Lon protease-like protein